jgi:hypothetical protein
MTTGDPWVSAAAAWNYFIISQQNKEIKCFKKRTILSKEQEASPEA